MRCQLSLSVYLFVNQSVHWFTENMDPSELKKLRNKQKKAKRKAEQEKQEKQQQQARKELHNKSQKKVRELH